MLTAAAATVKIHCEMEMYTDPAEELFVNPDPKWICGECGRTFTRRYSMLLHIRRIHGAPYTLMDNERRVGNPRWEVLE